METVTEIISLVKYSPKTENLLGNIKDLSHFESLHTDDEITVAPTLDKISATRWTVRGNAYKKIDSNYLPLMKLWDVSLATCKLDSQVEARIIGVQNQMCEFQFFYGLNLNQRLLSISDNLSKTLQKESMSALSGLHLAELTVKTYQKMRLDEFQNRLKEKLLIILSSTRLHYRVKEKGQTMDLSIITFKLKDIAIVQTHFILLLRNSTSSNNILKTSVLSYHQLKIVSINLLSQHSSKWSSFC